MPRIFDYAGREVDRSTTVGSLISKRGSAAHSAQVTAATAEEAAAAETAGIEMVLSLSQDVSLVREGSTQVFVTAVIDYCGAVSDEDLLRASYTALNEGADAIITARRAKSIRRLTEESIPVMGHVGFNPVRSTLYGGIRAIGKTAVEAIALWDQFRRLEDAGAFGVECEVIPAPVMSEINKRTGLVTISLGSGPDADVMFLFASDVCGESSRLPRHARAYADLAGLRAQIIEQRVKGFSEYRAEVADKKFPGEAEVVAVDADELAQFVEHLSGDD